MINKIISFGVGRLFTGTRTGSPFIAGIGAAISIIGWLRKRSVEKDREVIYSADLKDGEALNIKFMRGKTVVDEQIVEG